MAGRLIADEILANAARKAVAAGELEYAALEPLVEKSRMRTFEELSELPEIHVDNDLPSPTQASRFAYSTFAPRRIAGEKRSVSPPRTAAATIAAHMDWDDKRVEAMEISKSLVLTVKLSDSCWKDIVEMFCDEGPQVVFDLEAPESVVISAGLFDAADDVTLDSARQVLCAAFARNISKMAGHDFPLVLDVAAISYDARKDVQDAIGIVDGGAVSSNAGDMSQAEKIADGVAGKLSGVTVTSQREDVVKDIQLSQAIERLSSQLAPIVKDMQWSALHIGTDGQQAVELAKKAHPDGFVRPRRGDDIFSLEELDGSPTRFSAELSRRGALLEKRGKTSIVVMASPDECQEIKVAFPMSSIHTMPKVFALQRESVQPVGLVRSGASSFDEALEKLGAGALAWALLDGEREAAIDFDVEHIQEEGEYAALLDTMKKLEEAGRPFSGEKLSDTVNKMPDDFSLGLDVAVLIDKFDAACSRTSIFLEPSRLAACCWETAVLGMDALRQLDDADEADEKDGIAALCGTLAKLMEAAFDIMGVPRG